MKYSVFTLVLASGVSASFSSIFARTAQQILSDISTIGDGVKSLTDAINAYK